MSIRLACSAFLVIQACSGGAASPTAPTNIELASAKLRWAHTAPAAYQITVRLGCFCPVETTRPVIVTVRNGQVEARRYADTGVDVDPGLATAFPTVDGLFALIDGAIARHAERVDVTYDPTRGFPVSIAIDGSMGIADDETFYSVGDFVVR